MRGILRVIPVLLCAILIGVSLNVIQLGELISFDRENDVIVASEKIYTHQVAEGLSLQSGAFPGGNLVCFDSCRIEKQKRGGFSFGAFNVLVIDNLKIVFPLESAQLKDDPVQKQRKIGRVPVDNFLKKELEKLLASYPQFSSLRINGLFVDVVAVDGKSLRNVLTSEEATVGLKKHALELSDCSFLSKEGGRIQSRKAFLSMKPPYLVSVGNKSYQIAGVHTQQHIMQNMFSKK